MKSTQIAQRMYKDGVIYPHTKREIRGEMTVYTMFRHESEEWDEIEQTLYTITADYRDGKNYSSWIFQSADVALRTFRLMTGVI